MGIWCYQQWVYILRKHPGLVLLNVEESGIGGENGDEDENENDSESVAVQ